MNSYPNRNFRYLKRGKFWFTLLILIFISIAPLFWFLTKDVNNFETDSIFHFFRLKILGNFFNSPTDFNAFGQQGKITNIMYPPFTLLPTLVVKLFSSDTVIHWKFAWIYTNLLVTFITFLTFWMWTKNYFATMVVTILWTLNVYTINLIYNHAALANVLALAFYPGVLYGAYELFFYNYKKWYILTISISLVMATHVISSFVLIITLIILFMFSLFFKNNIWKRLKYVAISVFVLMMLSLIVIVPIIEQYKSYTLGSAEINWNISGEPIVAHLWNSFSNKQGFRLVNILCIIFVTFNFKKLSKSELALLLCSYALIILGLDWGQWKYLRYTPLVQLQYPMYRLQTLIQILILIIIANLLTRQKNFLKLNLNQSNTQIVLLIVGLIFTSLNSFWSLKISLLVQEAKWQTSQHIVLNNQTTTSSNRQLQHIDYTNKNFTKYGTKRWKIKRTSFILNDQYITPQTKINANKYELIVNNLKQNSELIIPISVYKGIKIKLNNTFINPIVSKYGTLKVNLKNKHINKIVIWYEWTLLTRVSQLISVISWILLIIYIKYFIKKENNEK